MADDFGRVNPVSPHFLKRGAREEPYQGRHAKKHHGHEPDCPEPDREEVVEEEAADSAPKSHIDLRI
jgi:hypothetical protein